MSKLLSRVMNLASFYFQQDGSTALHKAANGGHAEVAKMLLDANADPKAVEKVRNHLIAAFYTCAALAYVDVIRIMMIVSNEHA